MTVISGNDKQLLEDVESDYLAHLDDDPLPEEYIDLQATVRYLVMLDEKTRLKAEIKAAGGPIVGRPTLKRGVRLIDLNLDILYLRGNLLW